MLSWLLALALGAPVAVCPAGDESAPSGLRVVIVGVGQGSAAVVSAPDGTVWVVDGGPPGQGFAAVNPVVGALQAPAFGGTVLTHYDADHSGGMDEVLQAFPWPVAWDRGDASRPGNQFVQSYLAAAGSRRRTATPGQTLALGGGATLTVVAVNAAVAGGTTVPLSGTSQKENARSIAMRIDYGDFQVWIGGDLTGGGNGTADVESPAAGVCGDVDVYVADHHGSNTSTNATLVFRLQPELSVFSAGSNNSFGHPTPTVVNRLNPPNAHTVLAGTTEGAGTVGFAVTGSLTIDTDGTRYRATAADGTFLDFFVDEAAPPAPSSGLLRISELHRDPAAVPDGNGEFVELTNISARPVSLRGVRVASSSGAFTHASTLALFPGRPVVLAADGAGSRNGGLPMAAVWPYRALSLPDNADTLSLRSGAVPLDQVSWSATFPGGSGVAAERIDLEGPSAAGNFAAAPRPYGAGDRGSPGQRNAVDASQFRPALVVTRMPGRLRLHAAALSHGGATSVVGLSFSASSGFSLLGRHVPLDPDPLLLLSVTLPEFVAGLPAEGYRSVDLALPMPNPAAGSLGFGAHLTLNPFSRTVRGVSPAVPFVFP